MSLEKQLRGVSDRARQLLTHIEAARDFHAAEDEHLVGFEMGSALGELHLLERDLVLLAEEHFRDER